MGIDLQKASIGKRIIAFIFDFICVITIAVGLMIPFSAAVGYNDYADKLDSVTEKYRKEYNIPEITSDEYDKLSAEEKEAYTNDYNTAVEAANKALENDEEAKKIWNMVTHLSLLIVIIPLLISFILYEFVLPLFLKNGQTLGKKIFGIALMHKEGIRVKNIQLFIRALFGKFVVETMLVLFVIIYFGLLTDITLICLLIYVVAQIICMVSSHSNSPIHDLMAGTVAVDMASQRIFETYDQLIEHNKKIAAERAKRQTY